MEFHQNSVRILNSRKRLRFVYVSIGILLLAISLTVIFSGLNPTSGQQPPPLKFISVPALAAPQLLADHSLASKYNVTGLLWITTQQKGPVVLQARPGQAVEIPLTLKFVSFSNSASSVLVNLNPTVGQLSKGQFDISGSESYSVRNITVGEKPTTVMLTLSLPSTVALGSYTVVPAGFDLVPLTGTFIYYDTFMTVSVQA